MRQITLKKEIKASADKVWSIVRTGDAVQEWIPIVASCRLTGQGEGATRTCVTVDGKTLEETILTIDDSKKLFVFSIDKQDMMPITNIINKLIVSESVNGTMVERIAEFNMEDETQFLAAKQGFMNFMEMGIDGLEALAAKN